MKALVTGHKGFIGSNVVSRLRELQHECICFDQEILEDESLLEKAVSEVDVVLHIGAISDTSLQDEEQMLKHNYLFSKNLFKLCKQYNKKVVYSSSAATYGSSGTPSNIYGWSKLLAEDIGVAICDKFVSLRYFNVYGPGEEHKGKMASVAYQSWKSNEVFKLFPKKPKRDFVYVKDIVSANISAINAPPGIYEVGSGEARTFEDVLANMKLEYEYHPEAKIPDWYQFYTMSSEKKWIPSWKPQYNLEAGTKDYLEYLNGKSQS